MLHKFKIDDDAKILTEIYSGVIDLDALTEANRSIVQHPDFSEGLSFLTDLREAHIPFGYEAMLAHVRALPSLYIKKQAFVAKRPVEYGMIRMFLSLTDGGELYDEAQLFRSKEEGMEWLTS